MAGSGKRGGGERVLESRHLVGLFLGVVLLCAVFFTLGYVMGKTQYDGSVHAAESMLRNTPALSAPAKPKATDTPPARVTGEWDFYTSRNDNRLEPAPTTKTPPAAVIPVPKAAAKASGAALPAAATVASAPVRFGPPQIRKGSLVLQVAAVTHASDALAMADALQQKRFPSFVVAPTTDSFYRVQVGPYPDERAAESAKGALDREGFKAIIKR
jgi:DedD protein